MIKHEFSPRGVLWIIGDSYSELERYYDSIPVSNNGKWLLYTFEGKTYFKEKKYGYDPKHGNGNEARISFFNRDCLTPYESEMYINCPEGMECHHVYGQRDQIIYVTPEHHKKIHEEE